MWRYGVRLSVCPYVYPLSVGTQQQTAAAGLLLWAWWAGDIDHILLPGAQQQRRSIADSATLSAYAGWTQTCFHVRSYRIFLLLTDVATPLCYTAMHIRSAVADWREWDIAVHTSFKFFPHSLHSASTKLYGCIFVSKHSTLVVTYIAAWSKDEFSATVSSAKVATRLGLSPRNRQQTTLLMMLTTCILSPNLVKSSTFEIDDNL